MGAGRPDLPARWRSFRLHLLSHWRGVRFDGRDIFQRPVEPNARSRVDLARRRQHYSGLSFRCHHILGHPRRRHDVVAVSRRGGDICFHTQDRNLRAHSCRSHAALVAQRSLRSCLHIGYWLRRNPLHIALCRLPRFGRLLPRWVGLYFCAIASGAPTADFRSGVVVAGGPSARRRKGARPDLQPWARLHRSLQRPGILFWTCERHASALWGRSRCGLWHPHSAVHADDGSGLRNLRCQHRVEPAPQLRGGRRTRRAWTRCHGCLHPVWLPAGDARTPLVSGRHVRRAQRQDLQPGLSDPPLPRLDRLARGSRAACLVPALLDHLCRMHTHRHWSHRRCLGRTARFGCRLHLPRADLRRCGLGVLGLCHRAPRRILRHPWDVHDSRWQLSDSRWQLSAAAAAIPVSNGCVGRQSSLKAENHTWLVRCS
mmetsp:Transcript_32132/g.103738  ORF Transcript_32132/g.103738 Transcript_32132/m.103738 type:complete len:428 (+) Transcript_32132:308-1591(+)